MSVTESLVRNGEAERRKNQGFVQADILERMPVQDLVLQRRMQRQDCRNNGDGNPKANTGCIPRRPRPKAVATKHKGQRRPFRRSVFSHAR